MSDLIDLYQEVILDHNKNPRHFFKMEQATHQAEGDNPLCGDHLHVYLKMEGERIEEVSFEGSGCAISKASASLMTDSLKGKTKEEAAKIFEAFHKMVTSPQELEPPSLLGKLAVFSGVRKFPTRTKCATLAWHTLNAALRNKKEAVSTE